MKKYIKILAIVFLFAFSIHISDVNAGSATLSFKGSDTVKVNDTITLTVAASDISGLTNGLATAQGDLVFDDSYLEYVSFKSISGNLSTSYGTKTRRFVALGLSGGYVASSDDLFTLTFKAKKVGTTTLTMKDVIVGDTKAIMHSSNVLEKQIQIVGDTNTPPATTNTVRKAPAKKPAATSKAPEEAKASDNSLKNLTVSNFSMSPSFGPDTLTYDVVISNDVNKLDLSYVTNDPKATVKVEGNSNFKKSDKNVVKVIVTAEDGSVRTYTLNVSKSDDVFSNRLLLLNVKEGSLAENFDSDTYQYSIAVPKNIKKLTIDAIPERKDSKVEIMGDKNLGNGNSVVLIKLTDKNGACSYYRLNVKRKDGFKLFGIELKYIIVFLLLIFILIWLLLLFLKNKKDEEEEDVVNAPEKPLVDDLYDDVVTKEEIIGAIEEKNLKKLEMLLTQEEANKLKDELRIEEGEDPFDDIVTKEEIISAIENKDMEQLKMLLMQEKTNKIKEKLKDNDKK